MSKVLPTGFAGVYEQHRTESLSLDQLLIKRPTATYFMQIDGNLADAHIKQGNIAIVDRSLDPKNGDLVVIVEDGSFAMREFGKNCNSIYLTQLSNNKTTELTDSIELWGVVTAIVQQLRCD
ncbi:MAG: hypothetical protein HWE27_11470 [Gammaproteobacteria bacterium]|nr:hypothetical protein [Gammaproteobacteria bacterium]